MGAGEGRRKALREDSLLSGRATRSKLTAESGREGGAGPGDEGLLAGRKKEGVLSALIIVNGDAKASAWV